MLHNSFLHIPSIGLKTENQIWQSGITGWDDFLKNPPDFLSRSKVNLICDYIRISKEKIACREPEYFCSCLASGEHWRIFREFRDSIAYLDIETTGLGGPGDIITTIALYDGANIYHYVNGKNLKDFVDDIQNYKMIVSYNGKTFDIPFIERYFGVSIPNPHLDLRFILHSLGFSGGLKSCERQLGIGRTGLLADVDGFFAVILWREYERTGDQKALETLLSYNIEDAVNLEYLMTEAYNRKLLEIPIELESIKKSSPPENCFSIDPETVKRLKGISTPSFYSISNR